MSDHKPNSTAASHSSSSSSSSASRAGLFNKVWSAVVLPRIVREQFFNEEQEAKRKDRDEAEKKLHQRHYDQMLRDLEASYEVPSHSQTSDYHQGAGAGAASHLPPPAVAASNSVVIPIGDSGMDEVNGRGEQQVARWHDDEAHAKADLYDGRALGPRAGNAKRGHPITAVTRMEQARELHEIRRAIEENKRFEEETEKRGDYPEPTRAQRKKATLQFARRLLAEFLGSFLTVFAIAGMAIAYGLGHVDRVGQAIGDGLSLMVAVYAFGGVSGAHLNPIISLAFAMRHVFPWIWVPFYFIAQFAGSVVAAAALYAFFPTSSMGTTTIGAGYTVVTAFLMEAVLSMFLVLTVLATATRGSVMGAQAALPVGGILTFDLLIGSAVTGSGVNWFRSYAPALVSGPHDSSLWVYFVGQTIGTLVAVALLWMMSGYPTKDERTGGQGKGKSNA